MKNLTKQTLSSRTAKKISFCVVKETVLVQNRSKKRTRSQSTRQHESKWGAHHISIAVRVSLLHILRLQNLTVHNLQLLYLNRQTRPNQTKPQESRKGQSCFVGTKFRCSHQNMIHRLRYNDNTVRRDWRKEIRTERNSGKCTGSRLRRSGFQKPSSASLSSLLYPPDHWTKIPCGLHAVAALTAHARYCMRMRRGKHGKHHRGTTHGTLAHRIGEGMHTGQSGPIGPIRKGL